MGAWSGIFGITFVIAATQLMGTLQLPMLGWVLYRALDSLKLAGFLLLALGGLIVLVAMLYAAIAARGNQA